MRMQGYFECSKMARRTTSKMSAQESSGGHWSKVPALCVISVCQSVFHQSLLGLPSILAFMLGDSDQWISLSQNGCSPYSAVDFAAGNPTQHLMDVCMSVCVWFRVLLLLCDPRWLNAQKAYRTLRGRLFVFHIPISVFINVMGNLQRPSLLSMSPFVSEENTGKVLTIRPVAKYS